MKQKPDGVCPQDCPHRDPHCHADCSIYYEYRAKLEAFRKQVKEAKLVDRYVNDAYRRCKGRPPQIDSKRQKTR